jgi:DNA-binding transcriptional ArsR family regulator
MMDGPRVGLSPAGRPTSGRLPDGEYRAGARILLHLGRLAVLRDSEEAPEGLTQAGIAVALGLSRATVTRTLIWLVDGGAVRAHSAYVRGQDRRLKVYQLTSFGEGLVRHIREGMRRYRTAPSDALGRGTVSATPSAFGAHLRGLHPGS